MYGTVLCSAVQALAVTASKESLDSSKHKHAHSVQTLLKKLQQTQQYLGIAHTDYFTLSACTHRKPINFRYN
jgi:hypothetical protein